jgi:Domain of unknown function (DUF4124)
MEAVRMKSTVTALALLLLAGTAPAGEVYVTRDAHGNPEYTDKPATIPARVVGVSSSSSDPAEVQTRYSEEMKKYAADDEARARSAAELADATKARELKAEDLAKRCAEARQRYEAYTQSYRLYEQGPDGERRYLTSEEIDAARANAQQIRDQFCGAE